MKKLLSAILVISAVNLFGADAGATTKMKCGLLGRNKKQGRRADEINRTMAIFL